MTVSFPTGRACREICLSCYATSSTNPMSSKELHILCMIRRDKPRKEAENENKRIISQMIRKREQCIES